jgi:ABC-type branched-subunit amino acid transport system ATPase component
MSDHGFVMQDVTVTVGNLPALSAVSIEARPHQVLGVIGPNGAGKTTLLNVAGGVLKPDSGRITWFGPGLPPDPAPRPGRAQPREVRRQAARSPAPRRPKDDRLARALVGNPQLLLLDELADGLSAGEAAELGGLVRGLTRRTVILVEHHMDLVTEACDHVVVLESGRIVADGSPTAIRADPAVRAAYLDDRCPAPCRRRAQSRSASLRAAT